MYNVLTLSQTSPCFYLSAGHFFLKHGGEREIAHDEQFLLYPQCFLPFSRTFCNFSSNLKMLSANSFISVWKNLKFVVWEGLTPYQMTKF